jgi:hypothetical protein
MALAQEDFDVSQMSTGSNWITGLVLVCAVCIAAQMTKTNLSHAAGLSAWMFCVIAVVWDQLDPLTEFIAVAAGLSPPFAVGIDRIRKRWHKNGFHDDYDSFNWTPETLHRLNPPKVQRIWARRRPRLTNTRIGIAVLSLGMGLEDFSDDVNNVNEPSTQACSRHQLHRRRGEQLGGLP